MFAWGFTGGVDHGSPVSKGVQRSFEADACERFVISDGGGLHEIADDIVGDRVHEEFAGDHVGRAAAKDVHAEEGFEFAEVQLDAPTLKVEFAEGCDRVGGGIEKGGDD